MKYLVTSLLVPPGLFAVLLVLFGAWLVRKKRPLAAAGAVLMAVLVWLPSTAVVSDALIGTLERPFDNLPEPAGDVIILLGGGIYEGVPDMTGRGFPTEEAASRIITAARVQKRLGVPIIVSGGKVFRWREAETPVVARILRDLGVPGDKIIPEGESRDTFENARNTAALCRARGFARPVVVTSAYHMKRALLSFRKAGMAVVPLPAGFKSGPGRRRGGADWIPDAASLRHSAIALREFLGYGAYRLAY